MVFSVFRQFLYDQELDESHSTYIDPQSLRVVLSHEWRQTDWGSLRVLLIFFCKWAKEENRWITKQNCTVLMQSHRLWVWFWHEFAHVLHTVCFLTQELPQSRYSCSLRGQYHCVLCSVLVELLIDLLCKMDIFLLLSEPLNSQKQAFVEFLIQNFPYCVCRIFFVPFFFCYTLAQLWTL